MKKMISSLLVGTFLTLSPVASMASDCSCSKQCQSECSKGNGKDCTCKTCDCAKTGKCKHGECEMKEKS